MKTPLHDEHVRLHAKMVDFHGWDMPVWYSGIREEHLAVRGHAGLFDVSHMGEILVKGGTAAACLDRVLTRDIGAMQRGQVLYTFLLNERGGIIDDLIAYCIEPGSGYLLCVNSSNKDKDYAWMVRQNTAGAILEDASDAFAMLALQGPDADRILRSCLAFDLGALRHFHFTSVETGEYGELIISHTGYTGAGGVEIFLESGAASALWRALLEAGALPCGLGARDTLRLEMGYPLHGNDINEATTPLQAGLAFAVDLEKPDFIGRQALLDQQKKGFPRKLTGLVALERGVPREGCVCIKDDIEVGVITSGSVSPVTGTGIALAYVDTPIREGDEVIIRVRERDLRARIARPPFVKGTLK